MIAFSKELLPDPTSPIIQTNSPYLIVMPISLRVKKSSNFCSCCSWSNSSDASVLTLLEVLVFFLESFPLVFFSSCSFSFYVKLLQWKLEPGLIVIESCEDSFVTFLIIEGFTSSTWMNAWILSIETWNSRNYPMNIGNERRGSFIKFKIVMTVKATSRLSVFPYPM